MATIMFHTIRNKQIAHLQYKIISNDLIESFLCNLDMRRFIFRYWAQNEMYMGGDRKKREKVCRSKGCV